jgi:hypothetical protein
MSKGISGYYKNTHGEKISTGIDPTIQKELAYAYAENIIKNGTKAEKKALNTVTIAYDEENDKYYYGMNKGIYLHKPPKNVILFGDETHIGLLPKESINDFPLANCSEVEAINAALNNGAKLENLHLTTLDVSKKNMRKHKFIGKCSCENCVYAFKGKIKRNNTGWKGEN